MPRPYLWLTLSVLWLVFLDAETGLSNAQSHANTFSTQQANDEAITIGAKLITRTKEVTAKLKATADYAENSVIRKQLNGLFEQAIEQVPVLSGEVFTEIAFANRWMNFLSPLDQSTRSSMIKLSTQQPAFVRQLMFNLHEKDNPAAIAKLAILINDKRSNAMSAFVNLAVAICVVHETPLKRQVVENSTAAPEPLAIFDYYTKNANFMLYNLKTMPPEMLIWVVDTTNPISEMQWALKKYKGRRRVGKAYFDVRYDEDHFYRGIPKRATQAGYGLPNIHRFGGVCADQAFYATSVGKAIGVPTAMPVGETSEVFHAWVGFVHHQGRRSVWDFNTGRYRAYQNMKGVVLHPQTRDSVPDSFVSLTAGLFGVNDAKRHHAMALTDAMQVLERNLNSKEDTQQGNTAKGKQLPDSWINMFDAVLTLNPGNLRVWSVVGHSSEEGLVSLNHKKKIASKLLKVAGPHYPDFTLAVLKRLIVSVEDIKEKERLWSVAIKMFRHRPELIAEIAMERAKTWEEASDSKKAGLIYHEVVKRYANAGPFVVEAIKKTEEQLVKLGREKSVPVLYAQTLAQIQPPGDYAQQFRKLSNWYRVATLYHDRLIQAGQTKEAAELKARIDKELKAR